MTEETRSGVAPIQDGEDIAPYRITAIMEIAFILRNLAQSNTNIAIYFNAGRDMLMSRVLQVDAKSQQFIIDVGGHALSNEAITRAEKILFVTALDGVKVQFSVSSVKLGQFEGKPAFFVSFPKDLIKLQRREFFRLLTPITNPFTCNFIAPNGATTQLELHDISLGGAGIWLKEGIQTQFDPGLVIPHVMFDFGPAGEAKLDIEIRSTHPVMMAHGKTRDLLGCRFVSLPRNVEASLQRLLAHLDRERKALTG